MANIKYQFLQAINASFKENMDKHSIKKVEGASNKIFSYSARKNVLNVASDFANFINRNYTGEEKVKYVRDIGVQHINSYLISKKDKCTGESMKQICAQLNKLELVCNHKYRLNLDWHTFRTVPQIEKKSIRDIRFSDVQVKQIIDHLSTRKECNGKKGVYISICWGLRAKEIEALKCKDFDLQKMQLFVSGAGAKGGRNRVLPIKQEHIPLVEYLIKDKKPNDRVVSIRSDSICNYLRDICVRLNYTDILKAKTSIHCMRKWRATKHFLEIYQKTNDKEYALGETCVFLGHSQNRRDIARHYILLDNMKI